MIKFKKGNILNASEDIIAHQVNCVGVAGGLAGDIFATFPEAGKQYHAVTTESSELLMKRLGATQIVLLDSGKYIANLYGQYFPGRDYRPDELKKSLEKLATYARVCKKSVALPHKISCGICGGDWKEVLPMIAETMVDVECAIYQLED